MTASNKYTHSDAAAAGGGRTEYLPARRVRAISHPGVIQSKRLGEFTVSHT